MIIEVIPMVERAFIDLDNLKGGKGKRMLKFAEEVQSTGQYQGVQLNRHRHMTRAKTQTRLEQFTPTPKEGAAEENEEQINVQLFGAYDFYITFLKQSLNERFGPLRTEPACWFVIFDFRKWPPRISDIISG